MKLRCLGILVSLCSCLFALLPMMQVYAEEEKEPVETVEFLNTVDMGNVAITLQKTKDNTNHGIVVPYQKVDEKYTITNGTEPVWIRCKVSYTFDGQTNVYPKQLLRVSSKDWMEKSGYWYYKYPLGENETVSFLDGEIMSGTWTNEDSQKPFQIVVKADAVQEKHFTPDFTRDEPWFGTVIEYSTSDESRSWKGTNLNFEVKYQGGAQGLFARGDDLFSNFGTVMPGDVLEDQIVVGNDYTSAVNLYFRVDQTDDEKLADHTLLKIWAGTTIIYDGTLAGAKYEQRLALFQPGEGAVLRFEIRIPERLTNSYALNQANQKWIFRAEPIVEKQTFRRRYAYNTGAGKNVIFYLIGLCASITGLLYLGWKKKGNTNEKTEERD